MPHHLPTSPFLSSSPEDTMKHAAETAAAFPHGLILLSGGLGAGKTLWTKGYAAGLGLAEDIYSPTYTIMNMYRQGGIVLYHLDLYRIGCFEEVIDLGLFEILDAGHPCVIEWPERVPALYDLSYLEVCLEPGDGFDSRLIRWNRHEGSRQA